MSTILKWAFAFLVISIIAAIFGFTGIAEGTADAAKGLFVVFITICAVLFFLGLVAFRTVTK